MMTRNYSPPRRSVRNRTHGLLTSFGGQAFLGGVGGGLGWAAGERLLRRGTYGGRKLKLLRLFARRAARVHV